MAPHRTPHASRPPLRPVPEEVREWSALLKAELDTWPSISYRRMFGMNAVYRDGVIFAALPGTRTLFTSRSVIFKLPRRSAAQDKRLRAEARIHPGSLPGQGWFGFEISSPRDLAPALAWFSEAYEAARPPRKKG
jgi:hypothetical protein